MLVCLKENYREVFIGETRCMLKYRLADHHGFITNWVISQTTGAHFNLPGPSLANFSATMIEQTKKTTVTIGKKENINISENSTISTEESINKNEGGKVLVFTDYLSFTT